MKKCAGCGIDHPDTANYCSNCGKPLFVSPQSEGFVFRDDTPARAAYVKSHLVKAIFSAVCCSLLFGIIAIFFAAQVNPKVRAGDADGALETSKKANLWSNLAIGILILKILGAIAVYYVII